MFPVIILKLNSASSIGLRSGVWGSMPNAVALPLPYPTAHQLSLLLSQSGFENVEVNRTGKGSMEKKSMARTTLVFLPCFSALFTIIFSIQGVGRIVEWTEVGLPIWGDHLRHLHGQALCFGQFAITWGSLSRAHGWAGPESIPQILCS